MCELVEFVVLTCFTVILIKKSIFDEDSNIYAVVNPYIPETVKRIFFEKDFLAYVIFTPILLFILINLSAFILIPLIKMIINYLNQNISPAIEKMSGFFRRLIGLIWNIPKALVTVLIIGFLMNFSTYSCPEWKFDGWMNNSVPIQRCFDYAIKPVLHTNLPRIYRYYK